MDAVILAFGTGLSFALNAITARRAVIRVPDATSGAIISVVIGVPFFLIVIVILGQVESLLICSLQSWLWLSAAGILHFVAGRSLFYYSVKSVGANLSTIIGRVSPMVAVILGITVLSEPLTWEIIVGATLIILGVTVAGMNREMFHKRGEQYTGVSLKAFLPGIGAGIAWGISPIFIKVGLGTTTPPPVGAFISFTAASLAWSISLLNENRRNALFGMQKGASGYFCLAGFFSSTANIMRYTALSIAPASLVVPIWSSYPIITVVLSFILNRRIEVFNRFVIIGMIAAVTGTLLIV